IVSGRKAPRLDIGGGGAPSDRRRVHALSAYRIVRPQVSYRKQELPPNRRVMPTSRRKAYNSAVCDRNKLEQIIMAPDFETAPSPNNVARFFVENRHVSWVLFAAVLGWGIWAYQVMPKRKDPNIPVRQVAVITPWPGQSAERIEQLVTRKIEEKIAQNIRVSEIKSISRSGLSVVYGEVDEGTPDTTKEFDDIKVKLDSLTDLPEGAGPLQYFKDFGETSALMLTVASPPASEPQLQSLTTEIEKAMVPRSPSPRSSSPRSSPMDIVLCSASGIDPSFLREAADQLSEQVRNHNLGADLQLIEGKGFVGIRFSSTVQAKDLSRAVQRVWEEMPQRADIHPDVWDPIVIAPDAPINESLR